MNLCSKNHQEICYDVYNCPACELLYKIDQLEGELKDLSRQCDKLDAENCDLQVEIDDLKASSEKINIE